MHKTRSSRYVVVAALALAGAACSKGDKSSEPSMAERAKETSGEMRQTESLRAMVESVDPESRRVSLRDQDGHPFEVEAGPGVELSRLSPGDAVLVVYQESIAFALQDADTSGAEEPMTVEESRRRIPDGVQFGRQIKTTVEIVSVAPDGTEATFRIPEGAVRTVQIADARNQERVANLRPGDAVEVTYTEKLNVEVDPAKE